MNAFLSTVERSDETMPALVIAAPILPDKVEAWRRLCQEMKGRRRQGYEESRRQLGITSEAVWLLRTPRANVAVVFLTAEEPEHVMARLAASEHAFDRWFKEQIQQTCGLDLTPASLGPMMELVFNWQSS